jgi:hypothetical protein
MTPLHSDSTPDAPRAPKLLDQLRDKVLLRH